MTTIGSSRDRLLAGNQPGGIGHEPYIRRYVRQAVDSHADLESAAIWLAVFVANDSLGTGRPRATVLEAYRRVRAAADEEEEGS